MAAGKRRNMRCCIDQHWLVVTTNWHRSAMWGIHKLLQDFRRTSGLNYVGQQFTDSVRFFFARAGKITITITLSVLPTTNKLRNILYWILQSSLSSSWGVEPCVWPNGKEAAGFGVAVAFLSNGKAKEFYGLQILKIPYIPNNSSCIQYTLSWKLD
jgi:hypothetical protein